jgi:hypothetical protein
MNYAVNCLFAPLLIVGFLPYLVVSQNTKVNKAGEYQSPVKYAIVHNKIDRRINARDTERRVVQVLLKKESFSKDKLVQIFRHMEDRFSSPALLQVEYYTDLDDVETPEQRDQPSISELRDDRKNRGDYAVFIRIGKKTYGNCFMYFADGSSQEITLK